MSVPPSNVPPVGAYGTGTLELTQEEKTMGMVAHLLGIFTLWVGPLILYLVKKDQSKFTAFHSMQALILNAAAFVCMFLLVIPIIGFLIYMVVMIGRLILEIMACIAANKGEWYEIPVVGKYARQFANI